MSKIIIEKAPLILAEIQKAKCILLHCHPSPDPDSVGSALAMKLAVEQLGKKATLIQGDSDIPSEFMHFPGAMTIVKKSYQEIDASQFDLFLILDTADIARISSKGPVKFPSNMRTVNIDHHVSNNNFGQVNLIESTSPATCEILFELFKIWNIKITPDIAQDLFIGIFTDTGGFKYRGATVRTFEVAAELVKIAPNFPELISKMEYSNPPSLLTFEALAFNSIQTFLGGKMALSVVSYESIIENNIPVDVVSSSLISPKLNTVKDWEISGALVEVEPGKIKASFRTHDATKYDLSKLTGALGGGGHKAAAGATLIMTLKQAVDQVVSKAKELYNL